MIKTVCGPSAKPDARKTECVSVIIEYRLRRGRRGSHASCSERDSQSVRGIPVRLHRLA